MQELIAVIQSAVQTAWGVTPAIELTRPDEQFGDFATNVALQLSKQLGKSPQEIATAIIEALQSDLVSEVSLAGPGFINIRVSDQLLIKLAGRQPAQTLKDQTVVVEYSDPNPFKVLHAGHLYTSLVGDAIAKLVEAAGADVKRVNFGGDVGLHVGRAMWAIIQELGGENPEGLEAINPAERLDWISARYVAGSEAYETDEAAKAEIIALNKRVYQLHESNDHESPFAQIYWTCRQWSYDGFNALYDQLGMVPFDKYYPESMTTPPGIATVREGLAKGIFVESDGAVVYRGEEAGLHTRVFLNSNGLPTYEAKDLGLAQTKWQDYHFDLSVMVTGNDIIEYMKVVLAALSHFHPEIAERTRHLTHGMIKLAGGMKMSSRKGNILRASDVLDAAHQAYKQVNEQANPEAVLGAIRYAFLKQRIGGDIIYDPEESVSLLGNSGPYLQYAHARARSILVKATVEDVPVDHFETDERSLLRKLGEYAEVVERATAELMPHHVCIYLYELAQNFNRFYEKNRVVGDPRQVVRIQLVQAYADTLKQGLLLLNIPAPDKM